MASRDGARSPPEPAPEENGGAHRPNDSAFSQQRLAAFTPLWRQETSITCLVFLAAFLIPAGAAMLVASGNVQAFEVRYDTHPSVQGCKWIGKDDAGRVKPECLVNNCTVGDPCSVQAKCGMVARLDPTCPRDFTPGAVNYTNATAEELARCDPFCEALVEFTLDETFSGPVYMYYQLKGFYQNHRQYLRSRSQTQLNGGDWVGDEMMETKPILYAKGNGRDEHCKAFGGKKCGDIDVQLEDGSTGRLGDVFYAPAGLNPWSRFNDSFALAKWTSTGWVGLCDGDKPSETTCAKKGIEWKSDHAKYGRPKVNRNTLTHSGMPGASAVDPVHQDLVAPYLRQGWYMFEPYHKIPDQMDEDLWVWLRSSMLPTFQKLYRRIPGDLPPGRYQLTVRHRYDTEPFEAEKTFILGTASWTGGKTIFAGTLFVVAGTISLLCAVAFVVLNVVKGDERTKQLDVWVFEAEFRRIHGA
eukprot:TRINITY_DN9448_c0_g1_i1.p1 TRINITY_DN9448_c0_g1~~TRINITY_DN9448_c0_g1_i1.p1  ORF type:complete len:470 (+),score=161.15 TRINITY_DN9448_c0_g1_i1:214-1623(+)